ncbi:MAG: hypothetical protein H6R00_376 [Proteobacteria bacterium]|nr:hypothetical protein [Pseudomonadota bacterium]
MTSTRRRHAFEEKACGKPRLKPHGIFARTNGTARFSRFRTVVAQSRATSTTRASASTTRRGRPGTRRPTSTLSMASAGSATRPRPFRRDGEHPIGDGIGDASPDCVGRGRMTAGCEVIFVWMSLVRAAPVAPKRTVHPGDGASSLIPLCKPPQLEAGDARLYGGEAGRMRGGRQCF